MSRVESVKMGKKKIPLFFVERLSLPSWVFCIFPYISVIRLSRISIQKNTIYYIDATPAGIFAAKLMCWLINVEVKKLSFRLVDIRDRSGTLIRLRIAGEDLIEVQSHILSRPELKSLLQDIARNRMFFNVFLRKQSVAFTWDSADSVWRMIFLVHVACWAERERFGGNADKVFFADKRLWQRELISYAAKYNVRVVFSCFHRVNIKRLLAGVVGETRLRALYYTYLLYGIKGMFASQKDEGEIQLKAGGQPKVMVEYYGHLNLDRPEVFSDLFFWQNSQLCGRDILMSFNVPAAPLEKEGKDELDRHGISAVVLNPKALKVNGVPVFIYRHSSIRKRGYLEKINVKGVSSTSRWLRKQAAEFYSDAGYWVDLFLRTNTRVFVSWFNCGGRHCILSEALRQIGGVSVIYQRSFEELPSPELTLACDVAFGFSKISLKAEKASGSYVNYYVITGYLGDYRFPLLKQTAEAVRRQLLKNGAKKILAFFDENSVPDSRWHTGHEFMQYNYAFLLEKVIDDPTFGLVLKPKVPRTLPARLGKVAELLDRAIATGRCYMFGGGLVQGAYPPAVAALASDIAVHGHLCSGSAGVESALAGAPTLLLDREGWPRGILNRLGKGRVVFHDWESLWHACQQHWSNPEAIKGFGDWSLLIDELDPFRDGRAAERMGTYIYWIIEGFKKGLSKDIILTDAAQRYAEQWGKDKVFELKNGG